MAIYGIATYWLLLSTIVLIKKYTKSWATTKKLFLQNYWIHPIWLLWATKYHTSEFFRTQEEVICHNIYMAYARKSSKQYYNSEEIFKYPTLIHPTSWISKLRETSLCVRRPILFNLLPRGIRKMKDFRRDVPKKASYPVNHRFKDTQLIGVLNQTAFVTWQQVY